MRSIIFANFIGEFDRVWDCGVVYNLFFFYCYFSKRHTEISLHSRGRALASAIFRKLVIEFMGLRVVSGYKHTHTHAPLFV